VSVHVIATGGTISSYWDGSEWTNLDGAALVAEAVRGESAWDVTVTDVAAGPSANLSTEQMVDVARRVQSALEAGADGVVVTHGTDTMVETAAVLAADPRTSAIRRPVVFTGSMRSHSHPDADGPRNLADAVAVATAGGPLVRLHNHRSTAMAARSTTPIAALAVKNA